MSHPLTRKLEHGAVLSEVERSALEALMLNRRSVPARRDIAVYDNTDRVYLVMRGIARRYKALLQGGRRISRRAVRGRLNEAGCPRLRRRRADLGVQGVNAIFAIWPRN
ncbi:hypothetical protein [Methylobacterium nigriterrae]|uniref:hypothetical protein n=1 Tax=Methylobacterium nigriterrae TaxID=3127512 RepID=UPI003013A2F1